MLSKAEKRFISEQLSLYRCTEREISVYLNLLQSGPSSIQQISRNLGENRITIHSAVAQAISKGLLTESRKGKRRIILAEEPETLFRLLAVKENELADAKANLGYLIGLLRRVHQPESNTPEVRFYEGIEGFKRMLELTLAANSEFQAIIDIERFAKLLDQNYLQHFFERRAERGIHSRLIWPTATEFAKRATIRSTELKIQVRYLATLFDWNSGFITWDDFVSLKSFREGRITCTILENREIANLFRSLIFEVHWQFAKPVR